MKRTDMGAMPCPIARSLGKVGEWWSILILRDAFSGMTRFDEFQKGLNIAPNMLTRRLADLVEEGLLERRQYLDKPPRYEYVLTEVGRDFRPVLLALLEWGNRNFAPEGKAVQLVDRESGKPVDTMVVDAATGRPVTAEHYVMQPGPAATPGLRYRYAYTTEKRKGGNPDLKFNPPSRDVL